MTADNHLLYRARFRLRCDANQWILEKSYWSKSEQKDRWRPDSYHPRLSHALAYLLDRLVREGYEPKGIAALIERVTQAEEALRAYAERLQSQPTAEIEMLP